MAGFEIGLREVFGAIWTGILGIVWWDIRGIRKERDTLKGEIKAEYLTKATHQLLCENTVAQFKMDLLIIKDEIIKAIKSSGACSGCSGQPKEDR